MKQFKLYSYLTGLALGVSSVAYVPLAQADAIDTQAIIQEIKKLDTHQSGNTSGSSQLQQTVQTQTDETNSKLDTVNQNFDLANDKLEEIRSIVGDHYNLVESDYRNKEVAGALINYWAEVALKEYEFKKELHFMNAPGTETAIDATKKIKENNADAEAADLVSKVFEESVRSFTATEETIEEWSRFDSPKLKLFKYIRDKITDDYDGDWTKISDLSIGRILGNDRVEKEQAEQFLAYLTNPFGEIDVEISKKILEGEELTLEEQEKVSEKMMENISLAPSTIALSDMFGRRIAPEDDEGTTEDEKKDTLIEIMKNYSGVRFNTPEWYGYIGTASDTALLREIVHLIAYESWVKQQTYKLQEQEVVLLATMNANFTRMLSVMNRLYEEFEKANDEARKQAWEAEKRLRDLKVSPTSDDSEGGETP